MQTDELVNSLHPLERKVLPHLVKNSSFNDLVVASKLKDIEVMRALQWLENKEILKLHEDSKKIVSLDKNGISDEDERIKERTTNIDINTPMIITIL